MVRLRRRSSLPQPHHRRLSTLRLVPSARGGDAGLTLVEIVVAMFVLAVLAIAMVPLLTQGLLQARHNATVASATQIVEEKLDDGLSTTKCSALATGSDTSYDDGRGVDLIVTMVRVDPCPGAYPDTVRYSVSVATADAPGDALASASTLILLTEG